MTGTINTNTDDQKGSNKHDEVLGGRSHTSKLMISFQKNGKATVLWLSQE